MAKRRPPPGRVPTEVAARHLSTAPPARRAAGCRSDSRAECASHRVELTGGPGSRPARKRASASAVIARSSAATTSASRAASGARGAPVARPRWGAWSTRSRRSARALPTASARRSSVAPWRCRDDPRDRHHRSHDRGGGEDREAEARRPGRAPPGETRQLEEAGKGLVSLGEVGSGLLAVERFERLHRQPVQPDAAGPGESFVERVTNENVREAQATGAPGTSATTRAAIASSSRSSRSSSETPSTRASASRSNSRPSTDATTSSRWHSCDRWASRRAMTSRTVWGTASRLSAPDRADALRGEQSHDLADEERVSLGVLVERSESSGDAMLRRGQLDVLRDLALAQPAEREAPGLRLARDLGERLARGSPGPGRRRGRRR